jgi:hypothetical protein
MKNMTPAILAVAIISSFFGVFGYTMIHHDSLWTFGNLTGSGQPYDQMTEAQKQFNQNPDSLLSAQGYYELAKANPNYLIREWPVTDKDCESDIGSFPAGGNGGCIAQGCTVMWQAVDPAHPQQGGPGGCY